MTSRKRSGPEDRQGRGRRRRYSKQTNWTGIIGFVVAFGILVAVAWTLAEKMRREAEDPGRGSTDGVGTDADPASSGDRRDVTPERSPPELKGTVIIQADELVRRVRTLLGQAEQADADGDTERLEQLMGECRTGFADLDAFLKIYTDWLAEAEAENWSIPKSYETLRRRIERYGKVRERVRENGPE